MWVASGEALLEAPLKQAERQQCRVPLVHVVSLDLSRIRLLQQQEAAESEHDLLRQAVALVAAIERVGQRAIVLTVFGKIGVQ